MVKCVYGADLSPGHWPPCGYHVEAGWSVSGGRKSAPGEDSRVLCQIINCIVLRQDVLEQTDGLPADTGGFLHVRDIDRTAAHRGLIDWAYLGFPCCTVVWQNLCLAQMRAKRKRQCADWVGVSFWGTQPILGPWTIFHSVGKLQLLYFTYCKC